MTVHYPVAIVGGGLGGLTAARVLHVQGIDAAVFESEPDRHARVQGGMLDIHEYNGQKAIHAAELWEPFAQLIHKGGEAMRILDHTGAVLRDEADDGELSRPEVDRGQLRDMLIDSLPAGTIHWNRKAVSVSEVDGWPGRHEVRFANGESITTDLLIGADGAWSKVRRLVSDAWPIYTGISFIEIDLFNADVDHPAQAEAMGNGVMFALRGNTGILGHRETDGSLHVYLGFRADERWIDSIDFADTATAKDVILDKLAGWSDNLRGFVIDADTPLTPRRINALPVDHSWRRVPGVTLLGDAAHVMSPFAGEGANLAMYDASQLALAVAAHPTDVEAGLAEYESALFPRAEESARESADSLNMIFSENSPKGLIDMFASFDAQKATGEAQNIAPYAAD